MTTAPRVSIVSLGCSRNDVDSEELAGRLTADGWDLVENGEQAEMVLIADENIDYKKYSLIELENGRRKWVRNEYLERVEEDEELGIY